MELLLTAHFPCTEASESGHTPQELEIIHMLDVLINDSSRKNIAYYIHNHHCPARLADIPRMQYTRQSLNLQEIAIPGNASIRGMAMSFETYTRIE